MMGTGVVVPDIFQIPLDMGRSITVRFGSGQVIVDLPDVSGLSNSEQGRIIKRYSEFLLDDGMPVSMSLHEKMGFLLNSPRMEALPENMDIVTRVDGVAVSLTRLQWDGDIVFHQTQDNLDSMRGFLLQIHQISVKLYMKRLRGSILVYGRKLGIIMGSINQVRVYAGVSGLALGLLGLGTGVDGAMFFSVVPLFLFMFFSVVKWFIGKKL